MRDVGICIAIAASVAALIISLAHRKPVAQRGSAEETSLRSGVDDEPGGFA